MNVEIGAEAEQFPEKEYINRIALAVQYKNTRMRTCCLASSHWRSEPVFVNPEPQESIPSLAGQYDNPIWRTGPPGYIVWRNRFLGSSNVYKFGLWHIGFSVEFEVELSHLGSTMLKIPYHWLYIITMLCTTLWQKDYFEKLHKRDTVPRFFTLGF